MSLFGFFRTDYSSNPWENAPAWAIELRNMIARLSRKENYEMAQQQDIKDALDKMRADVAAQTTVVAGMSAYVAGIQKQLVDMANVSKDTETAGALMALAAQIESNTKADADAMASNLTGVTPEQAGVDPKPTPIPEPNPFIDPVIYNSNGGIWKDGDGLKFDKDGKPL